MGLIDSVVQQDTRQLGVTGFSFIDADTLQKGQGKDKKSYRLMGYNAPEISKILYGEFKSGTAGGNQATETIWKLANEYGFTNIKPQLDKNGNEVLDTTGSRTMADLYNDKGESFKNKLLAEGLYKPTRRFGTAEDSLLSNLSEIEDQQNAVSNITLTGEDAVWDKAASLLRKSEYDEGEKRLGLKATAPNEAALEAAKALGYGDYFLDNTVKTRHRDRNINNESLNPLSDAWEQGWLSVLESSYGFLEMTGDTVGSEWLSDIGEEGVVRARDKVNSYGTLLTDYRDVKGVMDTVSFLSNNMALSLPYMAVTAAGMMLGNVATPGIAALGLGIKGFKAARYGASTLAPSSVYAGMTWNEMEGEKSASIAYASGIAQATLDRLGIFGIHRAGKVPKELLDNAANRLTGLQKTIKAGKNANGSYKRGAKNQKLVDMAKGAEETLNKIIAGNLSGLTPIIGKEFTKAQAELIVANASRREIAGIIKDGARVAKEQYAGKKVVMDLMKRSSGAGLSEGLTEVGQEVTGYMSSVIGSDKLFDMNDLKHRAITAAVVGTALGGTMGAPGAVTNAAAWHNVDRLMGKADLNQASENYQFAEAESDLKTNSQNAAQTRKEIDLNKSKRNPISSTPMDERTERQEGFLKSKNIEDRIGDAIKKFPNLFKGMVSAFIPKSLIRDSSVARDMASRFGGLLQKINSGYTYETIKRINNATLRNDVVSPEEHFDATLRGKKDTRSNRQESSERTAALWTASIAKSGKFHKGKVTDALLKTLNMTREEANAHIKLIQGLQRLSNTGHDQSTKNGLEGLGFEENYFLKFKALSIKNVSKNRPAFEAALMKEYMITQSEASDITDSILRNNITNLDEAFSVAKGDLKPGFAQARTMRLSEKDSFKDFLEQDIFANVASYTNSLSRHVGHHQFVGKDGEVLAWELDKMEKELVPKYGIQKARQMTDEVALGMKNYLDAESGNYKRATTDAGKKLESIQRSFMLFTTLAGLPLSTISSFVELALTGRSLRGDQIKGLLKAQGKELGNTLFKGMIEIANKAPGVKIETSGKQSDASLELRRLGYHEYDTSAATTVGATEINAWQQDIMTSFFKWNGLQGWTNYTRAVRASIAVDYVNDKLKMISDFERTSTKDDMTLEVQLAREALRNLGMDVDMMVDFFQRFEGSGQTQSVNDVFKHDASIPLRNEASGKGAKILTPAELKLRNEFINEATFNFINEAVALPMSANRPLIYQDPRFALFTQFQGFMATFTANHIPRMWGEYVKRGSPEMKYSAFATMASMIVLGFASQALKDLIKYEEGENEYLDTPRYIRRGITSSGLLGTYERVLDQFVPMYSTSGPADEAGGRWALRTIASESPAASNLKRLVDGFGNIIEGDVGAGVKKVAQSTPFIGSVNRATNAMGEAASKFNFKDED